MLPIPDFALHVTQMSLLNAEISSASSGRSWINVSTMDQSSNRLCRMSEKRVRISGIIYRNVPDAQASLFSFLIVIPIASYISSAFYGVAIATDVVEAELSDLKIPAKMRIRSSLIRGISVNGGKSSQGAGSANTGPCDKSNRCSVSLAHNSRDYDCSSPSR